MSQSSARKKGYLYKLPVKGLMRKWSRRWFVLYATTHEGVVRLEYYDSEACERGAQGKRTIPLRDCTGVKQSVGDKTRPYIFELQSQIGHHTFACENQPELEEWLESIEEALHEDKMKRRQRKTQSLVISRNLDESEDRGPANTNYSDITEGTYRVTIEQNETAVKMALEGEYNLEVTKTFLSLVAPNSGARIAVWHYKFLKNYGKQHGRFHFETGKSSPTGEGRFLCVTTCSKEIFGVVHKNIKRLRAAKEGQQKQRQIDSIRAGQQTDKRTVDVRKQSSSDKRTSQEIAGETTVGHYRVSQDLDKVSTGVSGFDPTATVDKIRREMVDTQATTTALSESDFNPDHLYTAVNKKGVNLEGYQTSGVFDPSYATVNKTQKPTSPPPQKPQPYNSTAEPQPQVQDPIYNHPSIPSNVGSEDTNRYSLGSVRDSRDSAFVHMGSFDEQEESRPLTENNQQGATSVQTQQTSPDLINFGTSFVGFQLPIETASPETIAQKQDTQLTAGETDLFGFQSLSLASNVQPISGADGPIKDQTITAPSNTEDLINFDMDKFDENFFEQLDQLNGGGVFAAVDDNTGPINQQGFDQLWNDIFTTLPSPENI